ncbi:hypothetical protein JDV02_005191 [Purpureocillium takamizusanense]|uniref:LPXTG-domain-containing protein n=1 Tax=Purpureocillium takamizusanense TaxID=2060973 RepID=A0A9Q8VBM5_9HYPO|nr:uncharacterized protein JDV02_005191 [Purpureocillium takamizusanense]UNI18962.1 hypothetical protein JDV02_005191 [Purpureocillium takamizusanense]
MSAGGGNDKQQQQQQPPLGARFRQCVACLEKSAFEQGGEADQPWFLYNMRYAIDFCIFGYPNGTGGAGSNPCLTSEACGRLARALETGIPVTDGSRARAATDAYSYCEAEKGVWKSRYLDSCVQCVKADGKHRYLANFLIALDAACKQKPSRGLVLGLNDTVFANTTVEPAEPSPPSSPRRPSSPDAASDSDGGPALSAGAIAGIVVGTIVLVALAAGCVFMYCCCFRRRRRRGRRGRRIKAPPSTPSPPPLAQQEPEPEPSPLPLQRHSPVPLAPGAAGHSGHETGVMPNPGTYGSGAAVGQGYGQQQQQQQQYHHEQQQQEEEIDYDGRFFGNDKTQKMAQVSLSPVANSKPIAIWPARPAPDPPQGHTNGALTSIKTDSLPTDASANNTTDAITPPTSTVSTFSTVPLLSDPSYKSTGSPAVGSSPVFAAGHASSVVTNGLPRGAHHQDYQQQQQQQQWYQQEQGQQQQQQEKRKNKKRRGSSAGSPFESTKIQTAFAPPPKG